LSTFFCRRSKIFPQFAHKKQINKKKAIEIEKNPWVAGGWGVALDWGLSRTGDPGRGANR